MSPFSEVSRFSMVLEREILFWWLFLGLNFGMLKLFIWTHSAAFIFGV